MAKLNLLPLFLITILFLNFAKISMSSSGIKGAYWPSWKADKIPPSSIPVEYFTHLFYAFAQIDPTSYALIITPYDRQWMPNFTATVHSGCPSAKVLLSIGGAVANQTVFALMVGRSEHRAAFIRSTFDVARSYGFDGLDLDWEFPGTQREMNKLSYLFREWRKAAEEESISCGKPRLLITAATYYTPTVTLNTNIPRTYSGERIGKHVDFLNPMFYDYHGSWDTTVTGSHAALHDSSSNVSTSFGLSAWKATGISSEKLVLGLPMYGRSWNLADPANHTIGAAAGSVGPGISGYLGYDEILKFNAAFDAKIVYDKESVSTYSYSGTSWIGYDDVLSILVKIKFAKCQGLGGYFFWALDTDDNWALSRAASMAWDEEI